MFRIAFPQNSRGSFSTLKNVLLMTVVGLGLMFVYSVSLFAKNSPALHIQNLYSPRDKKRPLRPSTKYIVLHTTEGREEGSLKKIRRFGEAHYFVGLKGNVYRIIHRTKIATHAGRSYWQGQKGIDHHSIGIEVVGYHNRDITSQQYSALAELLRQLRSLYSISDKQVLTHSMVAYGTPNRFHRYYHRGRKRCGMIFARPDVRERLGFPDKPFEDPEVKSRRLRVADPELHRFLYTTVPNRQPKNSNVIARGFSAWTIAREEYDSPETRYHFPNGTTLRGNEIESWNQIPVGTQVEIGEPTPSVKFEGFLDVGNSPKDAHTILGDVFAETTTIYFLPNGSIRTGKEIHKNPGDRLLLSSLPPGTRILVGYVYGGHITNERLPHQIAGIKWNYPSTFYRLPDGKILSGDKIDQHSIPPNTLVFFQS